MSYRFSEKPKYTSVRKLFEEQDTLRTLRRFLDKQEPQLVYWLVNTWNTQGRALTYKQLREAILRGDITWDILEDWQQDYTAFVARHLQPMWIQAMEAASKKIAARYPEWHFDPFADGVRSWTEERAAKFVTEVSSTQIRGIQAVVQMATNLQDISVDQLARAIRPMVGLTDPQAIANLRYYEKLLEKGASEEKALDLATRYAARQHRYRAYNIARTEMAFSYNQGSYEGIRQAQDKGYMGDVVKIWCTADDERVCPICGKLEGKRIGLDEEFTFSTRLSGADNPTIKLVPPAHPSCRCAVMYKEITPPIPTATITTT